jgi:hypothetical protein
LLRRRAWKTIGELLLEQQHVAERAGAKRFGQGARHTLVHEPKGGGGRAPW